MCGGACKITEWIRMSCGCIYKPQNSNNTSPTSAVNQFRPQTSGLSNAEGPHISPALQQNNNSLEKQIILLEIAKYSDYARDFSSNRKVSLENKSEIIAVSYTPNPSLIEMSYTMPVFFRNCKYDYELNHKKRRSSFAVKDNKGDICPVSVSQNFVGPEFRISDCELLKEDCIRQGHVSEWCKCFMPTIPSNDNQ